MEIEKIKRPSKQTNKTIPINLRITPEVSKWLKKKGISPTLLFDEAVKELMENEKTK